MPQIEKSVFISYRRTNIFHARATFQDLRANGYDAFMDYETMNAGDFEQIIINQIKARAHFLVILTPSALERCVDPNDWLRREIETAIDYKRNIIPLMFEGFDWVAVRPYLTGKLATLSNFNALPIPSAYFDEAMNRLRTRFLNVDITTVLYPTPKADESAVARKITEATNQPTVTEKQLSANEYFERGNQHYYAGRYDDAIRDLTEAIRLNPQDEGTYNNRGLAYYNKNDYDRAIADYTEAVRLNSQDADAYNNRGVAYDDKKEYDHAIADYTEAIRLNPILAQAYNNRGWAYQNKEDYDRAITDYTEAIRLNPQYALAYYNRGDAYEDKKDYDRAIADYTEAIRLNPQYALAYNNRGNAYHYKKDYDRAIADYDRALQIDPNYANARSNRENSLRLKRGG
jgi:tetratricopeptide (TPR) repeat protein